MSALQIEIDQLISQQKVYEKKHSILQQTFQSVKENYKIWSIERIKTETIDALTKAFEIRFNIESDSEYVVFHMGGKKIMSYQTLTSLEKLLPDKIFLRVHRSYIVNMKKVSALKGKDLLLSDIRIPVSATYFDAAKKKLF